MKILHTSDWHLGKHLDGRLRIEEQKLIMDDIINITRYENVDFIIISGDIYDTSSPPAQAEELFYKTVSKLNDNGKRPVLIIAGNHDSENRLTASNPLANEFGIFIVGKFSDILQVREYENFKIINSSNGFFEIAIKDEHAVVLTVPYPSEKRMEEVIFDTTEEASMQKTFSTKIKNILNSLGDNFREETINLIVGHFYLVGGEISKSEREATLGGAFAVTPDVLPKADYVAMGHLHRPQKIKSPNCENVYYSGSPLQYSKSEANYAKCVIVVDINKNKEICVNKIALNIYKPIEIWKAKSIEDAFKMANDNKDKNSYVYLEIETDRAILNDDIEELHSIKEDIMQIIPIINSEDQSENHLLLQDRTLKEEFLDFYKEQTGVLPTSEIVDLFQLISERKDDFETTTS